MHRIGHITRRLLARIERERERQRLAAQRRMNEVAGGPRGSNGPPAGRRREKQRGGGERMVAARDCAP